MTIEIALLVACSVLVSALVWQWHRVTSRRLSEIQGELNGLRDLISRILLTQMARKTKNEPVHLDEMPRRTDSTETTDTHETNDALQLELELETAAIGELCAKLITLVPPQEAAALLSPDRAPSGVRERRLVLRHQTSGVGKIILDHRRPGDVCTVSNVSPAGALLLVANAHGLPKQFDLDMDGYRRPCIARWRQFDRIGVKFDSMPAA
jgi:hypothetical protein